MSYVRMFHFIRTILVAQSVRYVWQSRAGERCGIFSLLISACDMTHSYVRHDLFLRSYLCVTNDTFARMTWLIRTCDMTWLIRTCDMTNLSEVKIAFIIAQKEIMQ